MAGKGPPPPDRRRPPSDARERRAEPITIIGAATLAGGAAFRLGRPPAASRVKPNRRVAASRKHRSFAGGWQTEPIDPDTRFVEHFAR